VISGIALLRGYQRRWLRGDLIAGITVAAYLIPPPTSPRWGGSR
jgi:SulP family sulfate permease